MKIISSRDKDWVFVNDVIFKLIKSNEKIEVLWKTNGWEGIFPVISEYFGMNACIKDQAVTVEFTEENWLLFVLRWL